MALKAKYPTVLQIPATAEMRATLDSIAETEERSLADVGRELLQAGLDHRK